MILRSVRGNREFRAAEFGSSAIPPPGAGYSAFSGVPVTTERTFGLPAVMGAIRLVSEVTAALDIGVFRGSGADKETAEDSWQDALLDNPNTDQSQFDFLSDVSSGVEGYGNAFVEKVKYRGRVVELIPRDPDHVRIRREGNNKVFDVSLDGRTRHLTSAQILHFRGFAINGYLSGFSPITVYRQALGTSLALQEFQGRYFANDATPSGAIEIPGGTNKVRSLEILELFNASHQGVSNAGKPALLSNGATWKSIGISLLDAQFIEAQRFSVEQIADMFRVPPDLIGAVVDRGVAATAEQVGLRFLVFYLLPRLRRIESTLACDLDLFGGHEVYPEFTTDDLLRVDALTQAQVEHYQIQDGSLLPDEARAKRGEKPLPPIPKDPSLTPGMVPQITPVGGAPNAPIAPAPQQKSLPQVLVNVQPSQAPDVHVASPAVHVATPEIRVETPVFVETADIHNHVAPASVTVSPPDIRFDAPISIEAARAPDVRIDAPVTVEAAKAPDVHIDSPITVEAARAPDIHVAAPEITVEAAQAPNVTVEAAQIHIEPKMGAEAPKRSLTVKREDGTETKFTTGRSITMKREDGTETRFTETDEESE